MRSDLTDEVDYVGEGEDLAKNPSMIAYAKALEEVYAKGEDIKKKFIDETDKTSTTYFMTKMTQEEFDALRKFGGGSKDFETGSSRDERYVFNKIRFDHLKKLDETSRLVELP